MYNTKKMKIGEIRRELIDTFGADKELINSIKGKSQLSEMLNRAKLPDEDNIYKIRSRDVKLELEDLNFGEQGEMGDFELENEINNKVDQTEEEIITHRHPQWHEYVMEQLTKEELKEGNPTVDGLRRVIEDVYGTVLKAKTDVIQTPSEQNGKRATVVHTLTVRRYDDNDKIQISGAADVYYGNTDEGFRNHPVATAETRAEGRALRRALKLRKVVSAEEMGDTSGDSIKEENPGSITTAQITALNVMSKNKVHVNLAKLIPSHLGREIVNLKSDVTYDEGIGLVDLVSSYQSTPVPEELAGYNPNWQFDLNKE